MAIKPRPIGTETVQPQRGEGVYTPELVLAEGGQVTREKGYKPRANADDDDQMPWDGC
jgi:hypothetical protein